MELVFDTGALDPGARYKAWREAICDVYVNVDVAATRPDQYKGFIRETRFGKVALTDIFLSEQRIRRNRRHISQLDKDCYYLQFLHHGSLNVLQKGGEFMSNPARGAIFCATEQYELQCRGDVRAYYLEVPRDDFAARFPRDRVPLAATINTTHGMGRIAVEFCAMLAGEGDVLGPDARDGLGDQLLDILALTLQAADGEVPVTEGVTRNLRLRGVQQWIEAHLDDPDMTLEGIAQANSMSLRTLHMLFEQCEMSASEWIWHRRLQRCHDEIAKRDGRSITSIAFAHGFNSSAHFSAMFRRKFGLTARELLRSADPAPGRPAGGR
ncbi:helix-turn-helix domain-containing protein [Marinibaculum pumilum]|uniref:Helix-turn-helix domain-containing protein n=1 Tax=Marinibaculum pumilum TaxID=1766165 RepID=A0ABV7L3L5_9PROT